MSVSPKVQDGKVILTISSDVDFSSATKVVEGFCRWMRMTKNEIADQTVEADGSARTLTFECPNGGLPRFNALYEAYIGMHRASSQNQSK